MMDTYFKRTKKEVSLPFQDHLSFFFENGPFVCLKVMGCRRVIFEADAEQRWVPNSLQDTELSMTKIY